MAATTISTFYLSLDKYSTVGLGTGGNPVTSNIPKEKFTSPVPKVLFFSKGTRFFRKTHLNLGVQKILRQRGFAY